MFFRKVFNILVTVSLLVGCTGHSTKAPVNDRLPPPSTKVGYHVVAPGETLYSIAWRYNLNYKDLAKANRVGRRYTIYPGQKLSIRGVSSRTNPPSKASVDAPSVQVKAHTEVVGNRSKARLIKPPKVVVNKPAPKVAKKNIEWRWPVRGKLLSRFKSNGGLNKGVDIGGKLREPVYAAASGTVVYSGEGLRGYGKLIIIKHSSKYLSAYAHNHRILVKEGDKVKVNEKIAEMGKTGTDLVKLHFEIRFDGRPVDPLAYLPPGRS